MPNASVPPASNVEPWLRGTRRQTPAVARAVLHALDLAREDFQRWVWTLPKEQWEEKPFGLPSLAFQARHVANSLDRLLTYAEGGSLTEAQLASLQSEHVATGPERMRQEFETALTSAEQRVLALPLEAAEETRRVGRAELPVSLAGLLVHLADHTQRHAGQAVTTAKLMLALKDAGQS